jgi:hypothetical protein
MNEHRIEQQVFTYPLLFKIIFRYGNIILNPIIILYSVPLFKYLDEKIIIAFPLIINLFLIYLLNRHYLNLYKILPYRIEVDNEKIKCSDYFLSAKEIIIRYEDIQSLSGGIFDNKLTGIMKLCDEKKNICIGFYHRLNNSHKLAAVLLSKINRPLYDQVLPRILDGKKKVLR